MKNKTKNIGSKKQVKAIKKTPLPQKASSEWQATFDAVSDAICLLDVDQRIMRCNRTMNEMFGVTQDELIGRHCWEILHGTKEPIPECPIKRVKSSLQREEMELQREGRWLHVIAYPLLDGNQSLIGLVHIIRDITERKKEEKALRETTMMLESSIKSSPMAIIVVDNDDKVSVWNPAAEHMFGWSEQEVIGQTVPTIPDHKKEEFHKIREVMERKEVIRMERTRRKKKDGSLFDVSLSVAPVINADGKVIGRMCTFSDITEHLLAENKIYESEKLYRAIFENTGTATTMLSEDRTIILVNAEFEKLSGYTKEEVENKKKWTDFIVKEDLKKMLTQEHLRRNNPDAALKSYVFRFMNKAGETKDILLFADIINGTKKTVASLMDITDRKQAEDALRVSEQKYSVLLENAGEAIFIAQDGLLKYVNPATVRLFGYAEDVLLPKPFLEFIHPEDRSMVLERHMKRVSGEDIAERYPFRIETGAGTIKWVEIHASRIEWEGRPATINFLSDITERKRTEKVLQENEARNRVILSTIPDLMFIYNREGIYLDYHASDKSLLAVPPEQFLGKSVRDIFPVTLAEQFLQCFDRAIETKQTQVMEYALDVPKGPSHFEARITPMDDQRLLVIVRDITERREAELRLKESEERYRSIFENVQEGIYRTTPEGKIIMANQAMAKMYGYDSPQGIMAAITDVTRQLYVHPEEREKMKGIIETHGSVRNYEVHQYRRNGSTFWLSLTMQAVRDETGRILCYDGISEDITDRKESFEKLRKALGATVHAIAVVVETRDPYTAGHQRRVADLARAIATEMGLTTDQIDGVRMAGVIHDLGKISVPAEILSKPTKLTNLEFRLIKTHAQSGYDILKNIEFPWPIARMVLEHHERMDGSGYPNGLTGDKLLIESRILAVADVVEAIASFRPYRPAVGLDEALDEITKNKGNLYDPEVVDVCLRLFHEKGYKIID